MVASAAMSGSTSFSGFADGEAKFFKALARNQKRDWFMAHKAEFEEGWNAPMKLLLADLRAALDRAYPHCDLGEPKVFRIFRDVRFSKDKSPYKTHVGGHVPIKSAKPPSGAMAAYVHVGDKELFAAAGYYMMDGPALARCRAAIADDGRGKELVKLIAKLEKKGFELGSHETMKRVPKGFDPEHPRAELLKKKGIVVTFPDVPRKLLTSKALVPWLVDRAKEAAPLVEWLVYATA
jgi:uncharacterized protein (TIGR02453 family)